ncbi:MAG: nucleotidyl transferase AbiEii/AbiGii toxin family protein [Erysipelotrichaceae bacterium]|nr:nucleotidyl transferase AbiEii/AbiGii toxin family protein [Erysipelotrichaceae bacterium]
MKTAQSVKDRLKATAKKQGKVVQDVFTMYVLEKVLYRLSISDYRDNFTLKGGILLYGMFDEFDRITTDIDLLGNSIKNDAENIKDAFVDILKIECDDAINFDFNSLEAKNITEFKEYHGVNVSFVAYMDRTKIPVNIDIGFGDVIYPERQAMDYPTILDDESPHLYAYSKESIVAEKFEAIVSLGIINSRLKDFYDISVLSEQFDFKGRELKQAIIETFSHRKTSLERIDAFSEGFSMNSERNARWQGFLKTKHVNKAISLNQAIEKIRAFISPVIEAILEETDFNLDWSHTDETWK